jgi:hypothetical protein
MVDVVKTSDANSNHILHFAGSTLFFKLFDETIQLIQEASFYLEGAGRIDVSSFPFKASQIYNIESVQLTNRLMEVSSWLLAHRSYYRGETQQLKKIALRDENEENLNDDALALLPIRMCALIQKSKMLHQRIKRLNHQMMTPHTTTLPPLNTGRPHLTIVHDTQNSVEGDMITLID